MRVRSADLQVMSLALYPLSYAAVLTTRIIRIYTTAPSRTESLRAPVAQWIERVSYEHKAAGSRPVGSIRFYFYGAGGLLACSTRRC